MLNVKNSLRQGKWSLVFETLVPAGGCEDVYEVLVLLSTCIFEEREGLYHNRMMCKSNGLVFCGIDP